MRTLRRVAAFAAALLALGASRGAQAQVPGGDGGAPPAAPSAGSADGGVAGDGGATAAPAGAANLPSPVHAPPPQTETFIPLPPLPEGAAPRQRRAKPLKMTVGIPPTASDLGSEADTVDSSGVDVAQTQNWTLNIKGYIRAPMRVSVGPTDRSPTDAPTGLEFHSPPRMVGFGSSNWAYIAIAPNSSASLRTTISSSRVAGTLILSSSVFPDSGYQDLDSSGGVAQAYLTVKFPDVFGSRGGLVFTAGSFSNSYGTAGRKQTNTGFYGTYLFGRIHGTGGDLTANIDITPHVELLLEHGFGAKLDLIPRLGDPPKQMFLPGDPNKPLGTNLLHHAHAGLRFDDWLMIGAHYLTSWTPNDQSGQDNRGIHEARLSVVGGDVHLEHETWGSGYIGYSHIWGENLLPLDNALQVMHGGRGYDFKLQYFGNKFRQYKSGSYLLNDGGRVDSILFQWTLRSYELLGYSYRRMNLALNLFGMYSHAFSPPSGMPLDLRTVGGPFFDGGSFTDNKLKYGTMLEFAWFKYLSINARFDRVQPSSFDPEQSYTALTGQVILRSDWRSSRQIIVGYTRFLLGAHDYPDTPYSASYKQADPNLFLVSAIMSL